MDNYTLSYTGAEIDKAIGDVGTINNNITTINSSISTMQGGIEELEAGKVPFVHRVGEAQTLTNVASRYFAVAGNTKSIKIKFPVDGTVKDNYFVNLKLLGWAFSGFEMLISGLVYNNAWSSPRANLIGKNPFAKVKFGYENGYPVILLVPASGINNPGVLIDKVYTQHVGYQIPHDGWSIELITDESGITNIVETPVNWVTTDDGVWYDLPLWNGAECSGSAKPQYRKIGNKVELRGNVKTNSTATVVIANLPEDFRPNAQYSFAKAITAWTGSVAIVKYLTIIGSSGNVLVWGKALSGTSTVEDSTTISVSFWID